MAEITFLIPENKIQRVINAIKGLYPIPVYPPEHPQAGQPMFTDNQWAKETVRRWIRDQVARWEQKLGKDAIAFSPDDGIIS